MFVHAIYKPLFVFLGLCAFAELIDVGVDKLVLPALCIWAFSVSEPGVRPAQRRSTPQPQSCNGEAAVPPKEDAIKLFNESLARVREFQRRPPPPPTKKVRPIFLRDLPGARLVTTPAQDTYQRTTSAIVAPLAIVRQRMPDITITPATPQPRAPSSPVRPLPPVLPFATCGGASTAAAVTTTNPSTAGDEAIELTPAVDTPSFVPSRVTGDQATTAADVTTIQLHTGDQAFQPTPGAWIWDVNPQPATVGDAHTEGDLTTSEMEIEGTVVQPQLPVEMVVDSVPLATSSGDAITAADVTMTGSDGGEAVENDMDTADDPIAAADSAMEDATVPERIMPSAPTTAPAGRRSLRALVREARARNTVIMANFRRTAGLPAQSPAQPLSLAGPAPGGKRQRSDDDGDAAVQSRPPPASRPTPALPSAQQDTVQFAALPPALASAAVGDKRQRDDDDEETAVQDKPRGGESANKRMAASTENKDSKPKVVLNYPKADYKPLVEVGWPEAKDLILTWHSLTTKTAAEDYVTMVPTMYHRLMQTYESAMTGPRQVPRWDESKVDAEFVQKWHEYERNGPTNRSYLRNWIVENKQSGVPRDILTMAAQAAVLWQAIQSATEKYLHKVQLQETSGKGAVVMKQLKQ